MSETTDYSQTSNGVICPHCIKNNKNRPRFYTNIACVRSHLSRHHKDEATISSKDIIKTTKKFWLENKTKEITKVEEKIIEVAVQEGTTQNLTSLGECQVCAGEKPLGICVPCGHQKICGDCWNQISNPSQLPPTLQLGHGTHSTQLIPRQPDRRCPCCRVEVKHFWLEPKVFRN